MQCSGPGKEVCTVYPSPLLGVRNLRSFAVGDGRGEKWVTGEQHLSHCGWTYTHCHCSLGYRIWEVPRKGVGVGQEPDIQKVSRLTLPWLKGVQHTLCKFRADKALTLGRSRK